MTFDSLMEKLREKRDTGVEMLIEQLQQYWYKFEYGNFFSENEEKQIFMFLEGTLCGLLLASYIDMNQKMDLYNQMLEIRWKRNSSDFGNKVEETGM